MILYFPGAPVSSHRDARAPSSALSTSHFGFPAGLSHGACFVWGYSPAVAGLGAQLAHGDTAWNPFSNLLRFLLWAPPSGNRHGILSSDLRGGRTVALEAPVVSCHTAAGTGCWWCHLCWAVRNLRADVRLNSRTVCGPRSAKVALTLLSARSSFVFIKSISVWFQFFCFCFVGTRNNKVKHCKNEQIFTFKMH